MRRGPDGAAAVQVAGLFVAGHQVQIESADFVGVQVDGDGVPLERAAEERGDRGGREGRQDFA
ncbi:MAG: hypothetical protein U0X20_31555 [Caldilineaceae bacterium]